MEKEIVIKSDEQWRQKLSEEEFAVTRKKGTERAFSGRYWNCSEDGIYRCVCCGEALFNSKDKFDSGSGWPSFTIPASQEIISEHADDTLGMKRTEITCTRCGAHLGHVFPDGPRSQKYPKGLRYCVNSASLQLQKESETQEKTDE